MVNNSRNPYKIIYLNRLNHPAHGGLSYYDSLSVPHEHLFLMYQRGPL